MTGKRLSIAPSAGSGSGWGGTLPLRAYPKSVCLDLRRLRFVVPTFLLRLRTFIDWHRARGREVTVLCPTSVNVNHYLARMRIHADLPSGTFQGLREVAEHDRSDVLIPITRLYELPEVDYFVDDLSPVVNAHVDQIAAVGQPFLLAVSELSQNGVEHGRSASGCYVAAQRYPSRSSLALCIADLGGGIPEHLRREYPDISDDALAIEKAMREGVSGTGNSDRGYGLPQVMEEVMKSASVPWATLNIRSGYGSYRASLRGEVINETPSASSYKRGTWVSFEFGAPA
jgi:hypothetical protein